MGLSETDAPVSPAAVRQHSAELCHRSLALCHAAEALCATALTERRRAVLTKFQISDEANQWAGPPVFDLRPIFG